MVIEIFSRPKANNVIAGPEQSIERGYVVSGQCGLVLLERLCDIPEYFGIVDLVHDAVLPLQF